MKFAFLFLLALPLAHASSTRILPISADRQLEGSKSDVELTRKIREKLVKDEALSMYAENITIVTLDNTVTLKGEVTSKAEGERIATIARSMAGMKNVNNKLVIRE